MARRAAAIWLHSWSIDLCTRRERAHPASAPLVVVGQERGRQVVGACCPRAGRAGVRPGMALAQARALFAPGALRVEPRRPRREGAALRALALWAQRLSPIVAIDPPDGLLLDVSGCAHLFGGEDRLASGARVRLAGLGFGARVAIGPTFGCARGVCRFGPDPVALVPPGGARAALAPLPFEALCLEPALVGDLAALGFERIGSVLDMPRGVLASRFGEGLLLPLDRALGRAIETIDPVRPRPLHRAERGFDGPTDRPEAIGHTVRALLGQLGEGLSRAGLGATRVRIVLVRSDMPEAEIDLVLSRPSCDPGHLWALASPRLERAHLGFGVEGVRVVARGTAPLRHRQGACWEGGGAGAPDAEADRLLDTLANRLGADRVLRAWPVASHVPERAFGTGPALGGSPPEPAAEAEAPERPTLLLDRPVPIGAVALHPDGPVWRLDGLGCDGVLACLGPERIEPEWWRGPGPTRDYFAVQREDGLWLWIGRDAGTGRWSVRGVWA